MKEGQEKEGRVCFFVNKKAAKKTLNVRCDTAGGTNARSGEKVFLVLFLQKKNIFLPSVSFTRLP
jgi:hypothetical protein